jgi:hypothetical protein
MMRSRSVLEDDTMVQSDNTRLWNSISWSAREFAIRVELTVNEETPRSSND